MDGREAWGEDDVDESEALRKMVVGRSSSVVVRFLVMRIVVAFRFRKMFHLHYYCRIYTD